MCLVMSGVTGVTRAGVQLVAHHVPRRRMMRLVGLRSHATAFTVVCVVRVGWMRDCRSVATAEDAPANPAHEKKLTALTAGKAAIVQRTEMPPSGRLPLCLEARSHEGGMP